MQIKNLVTRITYKIEPKDGGGFVARSVDPNVPPIEASTREDLQKKIQAEIVAAVGRDIPGLKLPFIAERLTTGLQSQSMTTSTVVVDSRNGENVTKEATPDQINQFAEQLAGFMGKNFPQLSNALAARVVATPTNPPLVSSPNSPTPSVSNQPIVPEASSTGTFFRFLLIALALGLMAYLFLLRR